MNRTWRQEAVVFGLMVTSGVALRVVLQDLPNFAPVAALALFAGYFFRSRWLALAVPFTVMGLSDLVIGTYAWQMMVVVYGMLMFPVLLRGPLRRWLAMGSDARATWAAAGGLLGCSLAASLLFFLTTNFGAWWWFDTYDRSLAGLLQCYAAALPFFRFTLAGDLSFGLLFFGGYALAALLATPRRKLVPVESRV